MTEREFLAYCQSQISGELKEEDIITMLTAWGSIKYSAGYADGKKEEITNQAD